LKLNYDFSRIPCHNCGGMMIPEVRVIVDGVFEVRWTCNKCGAVKGAIVGVEL
jgi:RNase P subunit RPR2